MTASRRDAATVALALIEEATTETAADEQTVIAREAGASRAQIRRAWRHRVAARHYRTGLAS